MFIKMGIIYEHTICSKNVRVRIDRKRRNQKDIPTPKPEVGKNLNDN